MRKKNMPKYVIERELPGIADVTPDQVLAISQKSCSVLNSLGPRIQWLHNYVTPDKIYCVYIAPNEEMIRDHAKLGGFPANRIHFVGSLTREGFRGDARRGSSCETGRLSRP
jgi:Protein of unknown function (DUF4242)